MADERVRQAVKITDPTTDANEATVSATGALLVDVEEFPTAGALADATANPTTTAVGAHLMGFNGTTWDRGYMISDGDTVAAATTGFLVLGTDGSNYQAIAVDATGVVQVDVVTGGGGATETDDDAVASGLTPVLVLNENYGFNGATWERLTTDGSGSLDVNVTLALPAGTNEIGDIGSINTNIVPGVAATSLGKAEDAAHVTGDTGVMALAVRQDAAAALATTDGDYIPLIVDANGRLHVTDPGAGGGTTDTDDDVVAGGQVVSLQIGLNYAWDGAQWERLNSDAAGSLDVNNTSMIPGVGASNLGKAEDAAHGSGDTGVMALAVRQDTAAALATTDGDYIPLITDASGRLHVTDPNAGAGTPTTPVVERPALATVAAGAASTGTELRTSDLGGNTHQLSGVDISSSAPYKFDIIQEDNDVETIRVTGFGRAGEIVQWRPSNKAYFNITFGATGGFDGWRVEVTNLDNSQSADFYSTFYYED